jgi:hypothetical protein
VASIPTLRDDFITKTEYAYWQRNAIYHRKLYWIGKALVFATLLGWVWFVADIFVRVIPTPTGTTSLGVDYFVLILLILTLGFHFGTQYRTLAIASESIMRLKRSGIWETFLLTPIDTRRVVVGKWWAVVCTLWREHAVLGLLRMGAVVALGVALALPYMTYFYNTPILVVPDISRILVAMFLIFLLTLFNGSLTTAAGVVGGLLTNRREGAATPMAQVVRLVALLLPIFVMLAVGFYVVYASNGPRLDGANVKIILLLVLVLVDNGVLLGAAIINPLDQDTATYIVAAFAGMMVYSALTWVVLWVGQLVAYRQGMLSPKEREC